MRLIFSFILSWAYFLSSAQSIYVHTDKEVYFPGEILWFRVYVLQTQNHTPVNARTVAYLDLTDGKGASVLQYKAALGPATNNGGSVFIPQRLPSGTYTLTGATLASEAQGRSFSKKITILNPFALTDTLAAPVQKTYHVQFFPEGGTLVNGLRTRIGFKVSDPWGKGVQASLTLPDGAEAVSNALGIGSFYITPANSSAQATVRVKLPFGQVQDATLPPAATSGFVLNAEDRGVQYSVRISSASARAGTALALESESADGKTVRQTIVLNSAGQAEHLISKNLLPEGTSKLTLLQQDQTPIAERILFRLPGKKLDLQVTSNKKIFNLREEVHLSLTGIAMPGQADLSVSVKKLDDIQHSSGESIRSYFYLRKDLRGEIEYPDYYFEAEKSGELDDLLLTHGWRTFRKQAITGEDRYHHIRIRFTDKSTAQPMTGREAILSVPSRTALLYTAVTDSNGVATFLVKNLYGTQNLAGTLTTGEPAHAELLKFRPEAEVFSPADIRQITQNSYNEYAINVQVENIFSGKNRTSYLAPAALDSIPFFGKPEVRYRLDDYTRFVVMEEVMREYVREVMVRKNRGNFYFRNLDAARGHHFGTDPLILLDGVPLPDADRAMAYDPLKVEYIDVVTAAFFLGRKKYDGIVSYTTYKGILEDYTLDASYSVFTYEGLQPEREFYSPAVPGNPAVPDNRTVLYWTPRVLLKGSQNIRFPTSDLPGEYEVDIQGTDDTGVMGSTRLRFSVQR